MGDEKQITVVLRKTRSRKQHSGIGGGNGLRNSIRVEAPYLKLRRTFAHHVTAEVRGKRKQLGVPCEWHLAEFTGLQRVGAAVLFVGGGEKERAAVGRKTDAVRR